MAKVSKFVKAFVKACLQTAGNLFIFSVIGGFLSLGVFSFGYGIFAEDWRFIIAGALIVGMMLQSVVYEARGETDEPH